MAVKRNRWLVVSVLVVAIGAFLTISLLPLFAGRSDRSTATTPTPHSAEAGAPQADLEARAKGYELVLEREPDNQTAIQGLVDARIQLGDLEGTLEPLEKLSELNPEVPEYQIILGQIKQELGDLDGAAQAYRTVLTSNPGEINAMQALVSLLLTQNRPQAAIGLLEDTIKTAPQTNEVNPGTIDVASVKLLLAQVYVEDGQIDPALRLYDEAIESGGDDFRPLVAKALVLRELGKMAEAEVLFKEAETLAPAQFKDQIRQLALNPEGVEASPSGEAQPAEGPDSSATEAEADGSTTTEPEDSSPAEAE